VSNPAGQSIRAVSASRQRLFGPQGDPIGVGTSTTRVSLLPVSAIRRPYCHLTHGVGVDAARVYVEAIGVRSRYVERLDAAIPAKEMLGCPSNRTNFVLVGAAKRFVEEYRAAWEFAAEQLDHEELCWLARGSACTGGSEPEAAVVGWISG